MPTQNEEYDGVDALMAAITGEPVPEAARADAAYMAEHRAATADVALLREQLGIIGEALSAPPPRPEPEPVRTLRLAPRRHPALRALAYGTLAMAVVVGMITGLAWLVAHSGGADSTASSNADSGSKAAGGHSESPKAPGPLSEPELYVACSSLLVEGTVTGVQPSSDPRKRITLAVTRSYRPAHGPADVTVVLPAGASPAPRQGQHVLVGVRKGTATANLWVVGEDAVAADRATIVDALSHAGTVTCPTG
ncbi:hypothetical protein [Streptomyces sp. STR69]|uniref:hypothetical protein n=1 Tax=Streptomyces sp. STR69 TaxID=1796942 RepID=UPI0021C8EBEA|nr:hypothetical protein [Streptomyces sp. STR69]